MTDCYVTTRVSRIASEGSNTHARVCTECNDTIKRFLSLGLDMTTMLYELSTPLFAPSLAMHGEVDKNI